VLNSDGRLLVRNSHTDTEDRTRQQRYATWKRELDTYKDNEDMRRGPGMPGGAGDDPLFQRGGRGRGRGKGLESAVPPWL